MLGAGCCRKKRIGVIGQMGVMGGMRGGTGGFKFKYVQGHAGARGREPEQKGLKFMFMFKYTLAREGGARVNWGLLIQRG